jgi:hypothetical protein
MMMLAMAYLRLGLPIFAFQLPKRLPADLKLPRTLLDFETIDFLTQTGS